MKFGLENFKKDTPIFMRRIGYALYTACGTASLLTFIPSFTSFCKYIAIGTFIGAFLTNFFGEDKNDNGIPDKFE